MGTGTILSRAPQGSVLLMRSVILDEIAQTRFADRWIRYGDGATSVMATQSKPI